MNGGENIRGKKGFIKFVVAAVLTEFICMAASSVVRADYYSGSDQSIVNHSGFGWTNFADITCYYASPVTYGHENHRGYSWASFGISVLDCNITFMGWDSFNFPPPIYRYSWYNNNAMSKTADCYETTNRARTRTYTRFKDPFGLQWWDQALAEIGIGFISPPPS